jgi:hypothetical protein
MERKIGGKTFDLSVSYPTRLGAKRVAARIRKEVPEPGYLVRIAHIAGNRWGVYVRDETKKPWRT